MISAPDPAEARAVSPALVGRDRELAALVSAVTAAPAVVTIEGEAGVGKTRLVSELRARPELAGRWALLGRCHQIRESFPLGPVVDAFRGVGEELGGLRLTPVAGALRPLLPELAGRLPPAPEPLEDRAAERHRVFRAMAEILAGLPPAVLVLEDLHWADEQTTEFLAYLLTDPPPGLALVLTFRAAEVSPVVRVLNARLPPSIHASRLVLGRLDQPGTGALAAAILGAERVPDELSGYLWDRTDGLPLAVEEVLALVRARGLAGEGGWGRPELDALGVPRGIRDSTLARVARLPPAAARAAEAAAVLQEPVPLPVLDAMIDSAGVAGALAGAIGSGLLSEHGDAVGFRHVLAAQAVYESLSGPRRRELHGHAADALAALPAVPLGQLAHHLRGAGRVAEWSATAEAAADQAVALANETEAVRLLADVLRHAPLAAERRGRIAVKLGWAALETLHARDVVDILAPVLQQNLPAPILGELRFLLAQALNQNGDDLPRQRELFLEAIDLTDRPELRGWAMVALSIPVHRGVRLAEHLTWLHEALDLAAEVGDLPLELQVLGKAGAVLQAVGDPGWRGPVDRLRRLAGDSPQQRRAANAYYSVGLAACFIGRLGLADHLLSRAGRSTAAAENRRLEVVLRSGRAVLSYLQGDWAGLGEEVSALRAELSDYPPYCIDLDVVAGCLELARGDVGGARCRLAALIALTERLGSLQVLALATEAAIRAALFQGEVDEAVAAARRCLEPITAKGVWAPAGRLLPAAVEALVAAGEQAPAQELVDRAEQELAGLDAPLAPAATRYARGVLAEAAGDLPAAAVEFQAAAGAYRAASAPYEAARAAERAAGCLLDRAGEEGAAALRDAAATYRRLGASWDHTRIAGLARRHGVSLPAQHRGGRHGYGSAFSPREREVAGLAARGRTNRQIAQELFISASTVEKHLLAAMRKLQVRSRTELAHRLSRGGAKMEDFPSS